MGFLNNFSASQIRRARERSSDRGTSFDNELAFLSQGDRDTFRTVTVPRSGEKVIARTLDPIPEENILKQSIIPENQGQELPITSVDFHQTSAPELDTAALAPNLGGIDSSGLGNAFQTPQLPPSDRPHVDPIPFDTTTTNSQETPAVISADEYANGTYVPTGVTQSDPNRFGQDPQWVQVTPEQVINLDKVTLGDGFIGGADNVGPNTTLNPMGVGLATGISGESFSVGGSRSDPSGMGDFFANLSDAITGIFSGGESKQTRTSNETTGTQATTTGGPTPRVITGDSVTANNNTMILVAAVAIGILILGNF